MINENSHEIFHFQVKTGTEIEESLYDPSEVLMNATKFDCIFNRVKFSSTEDIDSLSDSNICEIEGHDHSLESARHSLDSRNSIEKGVLIRQRNSLSDFKDNRPQESLDKKKTLFDRLSKVFVKNRKLQRNTRLENTLWKPRASQNGSVKSSGFSNTQLRLFDSLNQTPPRNQDDDDDGNSSISSVLSAADESDGYVSSPILRKRYLSYQNTRDEYARPVKKETPVTKTQKLAERFSNSKRQSNSDSYDLYDEPSVFEKNQISELKGNFPDKIKFYKHNLNQQLTAELYPVINPEMNKIAQENMKLTKKEMNSLNGNSLNFYVDANNQGSSKMSREEIMQKVYDYYHKNIKDTNRGPLNQKDNLYSQAQTNSLRNYKGKKFLLPIKIYQTVDRNPPHISDLRFKFEPVISTPASSKKSNLIYDTVSESSQDDFWGNKEVKRVNSLPRRPVVATTYTKIPNQRYTGIPVPTRRVAPQSPDANPLSRLFAKLNINRGIKANRDQEINKNNVQRKLHQIISKGECT